MNRPDEILKEIANVIWEQIWASTEWNVVGSWGTNKLAYTEIQDYPALTFLVRGIKFQGRVFVALDESNDTYKLFLMKEEGEEPQLVCETINCDQLGEIIDQYVESGDDEDEYQSSLAKILEDLIM